MADSPWLLRVILTLIVINAAVLGLETVPRLEVEYGTFFHLFNEAVLWIFVLEALVKISAYRWRYFTHAWNIFDFLIVLISFIPAVGAGVVVVRLLRLLRLVSLVPDLRMIIEALFRSIASIGAVIFLLMLIFYIYAVSGVHFFSEVDPEHWGDLSSAFVSLFSVLTFDNWTDIYRATGISYAWFFFLSFVFIAAFVTLNLFIAIILSNLQRVENEAAKRHHLTLMEELRAVKEHLMHMEHKR